MITAGTATLAEYLKADLQRIANSANDELKIIKRAGMDDLARQAEEARVIDEARARAVRRVESTIRHLHAMQAEAAAGYPRPKVAEPVGPDQDETQVIPAVTEAVPALSAPADSGRHDAVVGEEEPEAVGHSGVGDDNAAVVAATPRAEKAVAETESDIDRLNRFLEFVVRQEPRLNWAVGDHVDGTTVLVTDLAHGWIPSGTTLPAGVRLLEPERRTGSASALIGDTTRVVTYAPGDSLRRSVDFAATKSSSQPRQLLALENLERVLREATRWREGLPRIVNGLAEAAAAGSRVVDQEVDVLRVHLDTARYQLLVQYPGVNPALLLNCLLLAATEGMVSGDSISANYHFAWYQKLAAPPPGRWAAKA